MTYPLIGNYGVNEADVESLKPWADCFIVHELAPFASNFRNEMSLNEFLLKNDIPGIQGIDTRALTKILREKGTMNGVLTTNSEYDIDYEIKRAKANKTIDVVKMVSTKTITTLNHDGNYSVALLDYGAKSNIANSLVNRGCKVTIYPCETSAEEILASNPDGIMLSNGPGDPKDCGIIIENVKKLYESDTPIFAICLGHQLLGLATGADTFKLKYGHRGANHPAKDLITGRSYITSQNHGYVVDDKTINPDVAKVTFSNCNDGSVEGLTYNNKKIFTVQFHPEASPGPQDTGYLFDRFIDMMGGQQ
jgi:carbamoyl-phosphate synthase small subunit